MTITTVDITRRALVGAALVLAFVTMPAARAAHGVAAGSQTVSPVYSTWDLSTVLGQSMLVRTPEGVSASLMSTALPPGQAITLWFVVFNNPSACATSPCTPADMGNPAVQGDFLWGGGNIVGAVPDAVFSGHLRVGDTSGSGLIELGATSSAGLIDPMGAEIHLALHAHGPALSGQVLKSQLSSFLGGCQVFLGGADGIADGPGDVPVNPGECSTFRVSVHQ